jgi:hypothetical protein
MRKVAAPKLRARAAAVGEGGKGFISSLARRWERGTFVSHGTYDVAAMRKPHPPVKYTETVPGHLVEVEPGHYATAEAAEQLSFI